jgi:uncharacterized protein
MHSERVEARIAEKEQRLREICAGMESCIVAYSGGVDSAYLAVVATEVLGQRAWAVTAESPSYPEHQRQTALEVSSRFNLNHSFISTGEMQNANYVANPANRCYFCKHDLYSRLQTLAIANGFRYIVDGTNLDDTSDYRPGRQAGAELSIRSPLVEAGLKKADIRALSKRIDLPTWNLPASACLSSRIPYGMPVTIEKLHTIERGEEVLRTLGFSQSRVRHHGELVRIEIARDELAGVMQLAMFDNISREFKNLGFKFVTIDVDGYRSGSLNETLISISRLT